MTRKGAKKGRKKIELKKIENMDARHVCFSKRKTGIFSKASELSSLCGVELALIVFSPAGNPYTFGCPKVEPILDRFLSGTWVRSWCDPNAGSSASGVQQLNQKCDKLSSQWVEAKAKKVALQRELKQAIEDNKFAECLKNWDGVSLEQVVEVRKKLEELKAEANRRVKELLSARPEPLPRNPNAMACPSSSSSIPAWALRPVQIVNPIEPGSLGNPFWTFGSNQPVLELGPSGEKLFLV